jgi:DhnA family fructose-bisphosphate aldolase class Ia
MRILGGDGRTVVVPIDQSLTSGGIKGLRDLPRTLSAIRQGQPDAVLMHRGPAAGLWPGQRGVGLVIHLSGGTEMSGEPERKALVCSVEEAMRLGADGVSIHVSLGLGGTPDSAALGDLGRVADECSRWGMPLLAMLYVYGAEARKPGAILHAARAGAELGADLIKVSHPGEPDALAELIAATYVPVLIAGGEAKDDGMHALESAAQAVSLGAAGVCAGRNVYQHRDPSAMIRALMSVVHEGRSPQDAYAGISRLRATVAV